MYIHRLQCIYTRITMYIQCIYTMYIHNVYTHGYTSASGQHGCISKKISKKILSLIPKIGLHPNLQSKKTAEFVSF